MRKICVIDWQSYPTLCDALFSVYSMIRHYGFYPKRMIRHYVIHPTIFSLILFNSSLWKKQLLQHLKYLQAWFDFSIGKRNKHAKMSLSSMPITISPSELQIVISIETFPRNLPLLQTVLFVNACIWKKLSEIIGILSYIVDQILDLNFFSSLWTIQDTHKSCSDGRYYQW